MDWGKAGPPEILCHGQVISGLDAVYKIEKGKEDNCAVPDPGKSVKMQIVAGAGARKQ
jgi:hypothetical protein